ncbi:hypothetical protein BZG36_02324 [Bifiguratus adelaidae]|uniref:Uncharacterized protein n=1 Tax=Bifiguratus adelaidae TaxID=1938954 RepID=A0A261Y2I9_9FUNG|nr:hypothetical protein BZG36_02324 [Bifiguratus adelaidae]
MAPPQADLQTRVLKTVKHPQFLWFIGHVMTLVGSILFWISAISFKSTRYSYIAAFLGACISYGVVVYKSFGIPQLNMAFAQRLVADENFQYLLLAFFWLTSKPILFATIPFLVFSLFHCLGYIRTVVFPTFFPNNPSANGSAQASGQASPAQNVTAKLSQQMKNFTDKNYGPAMQFVSYIEVVGIMGRLILGALTFRSSLMAPVVFAHFLRFRYFLSTYTRAAFHDVATRLDRVMLPPTAKVPPVVGQVYSTIKGLIVRYGQSVVQQR